MLKNTIDNFNGYKEEYKRVNLIYKDVKSEIDKLTINDFKEASPEEILFAYNNFKHLLTKDTQNSLSKLVSDIQKKDKTLHYTKLNELVETQILTKEEAFIVDDFLTEHKWSSRTISIILEQSKLIYELKHNANNNIQNAENKTNKIIEFLVKEDIVSKEYHFICECCDCMETVVTEKDLNKYKAHWEKANRLDTLSEKEKEEFEEELKDGFDILKLECDELDEDESEVTCYEELEEALYGAVVYYRIVLPPDNI